MFKFFLSTDSKNVILKNSLRDCNFWKNNKNLKETNLFVTINDLLVKHIDFKLDSY